MWPGEGPAGLRPEPPGWLMADRGLEPETSAPLDQVGSALVIDRVYKGYDSGAARAPVIENVSLLARRGQFVAVIGPSGCGKTTLLRIVAGLLEVDAGTVSIFGESVQRASAAKHIGLVPQSPALLPWRTVLDNVRLPLQVNKKPDSDGTRSHADPVAVLESFGLGDVVNRRPAQLSGGMQHRVAIARAFVFDPPVLLMDEPFAAVDELTREMLRHELLSVWQANQKTVLFVTHSISEAITLSDVVVIMSARPGTIQRVIPIGLPRPRDDLVETTEGFHALERRVRLELRNSWRGAR
jgi:NitT/TauT family transport system ATP-binding protein